MYKVAVLMSTYNGEKYLREQIDSILAQQNVDLTLFIRDDGSSDNTIAIIKEYQKNNGNIKLDIGKNVGVGNSFMQLLYDVGDEFDYYAFADQDDVWLPEKLSRAIEYITPSTIATLYASNQILVDGNLQKIGMRYEKDPDVSYLQIMCQNKVTGCTMLWNKELHRLLSEKDRRPSSELLKNRIHDVWVAMVASIVGEIRYDSQSYIWYRQHDNNVVGVRRVSLIKQWGEKISDPSQRNGRSFLCKEIYNKFGEYIDKGSILKHSALYERKKLIRDTKQIVKHSGEFPCGLRIKILLGLY